MTPQTVIIESQHVHKVLDPLLESPHIERIADLVGQSVASTRAAVETSIAEAVQTLSLLVGTPIDKNSRVLEVGAGFGFASLALADLGLDVVALEPGGPGFDSNRHVAAYTSSISRNNVEYVSATVEDMPESGLGEFDLVISNNVLEHVADVETALVNLAAHLAPGGYMVHSCPNYVFPFEPHFGIPLIPVKPSWSRWLLPSGIRSTGLWQSLNFVTYFQVRRIAREIDLCVSFESGTMTKSLERFNSDEQFAIRHPKLAGIARIRWLMALLKLMLSLPAWLATPMNFRLTRKPQSATMLNRDRKTVDPH